MSIEINRQEVEAVKIAVRRVERRNISSLNTLVRSIELLCDSYQQTGMKEYLLAAIDRIQAYLELGFAYEEKAELFNRVLSELGTSKEEQFPKRSYAAKTIKLTHAQIKNAICKWSSSKYHTGKKDDVVEDIIAKVNNRAYGCYEYHSNANPRDMSRDYIYILYVDEDDSYLFSSSRNLYFIIKEC